MELDMHYYGTYAMAKAAGIPKQYAEIIAHAAQFVDDSTKNDSQPRDDGGLLYGIATAHNINATLFENLKDKLDFEQDDAGQRRVWVHFHFFPGGEGDELHEKLICRKDSALVNAMVDNHIALIGQKDFAVALVGIMAHIYMDTFTHYGFSGTSSYVNEVAVGSLTSGEEPEDSIPFVVEDIKAKLVEIGSEKLGHAGVLDYPDIPYLRWAYKPKTQLSKKDWLILRDNPKDYLEACEKLHTIFCRVADALAENNPNFAMGEKIDFVTIKEQIENIIETKKACKERCKLWQELDFASDVTKYDKDKWENQKNKLFAELPVAEAIELEAYRFHQAAAYHRYYVLKDLLPANGIIVY